MQHCTADHQSKRWKTREVKVGKVGVGGANPVRIQSMTTSNTRDVQATIEQILRLADAGCEIARVTVQGMKEAESCEGIKNGLLQRGYDIPLVADIHFYPPAALKVVDFVDKVRVNPGNFVDKRAIFKTIEYDDATYAAEIAKIEEGFAPLVEKCKRLGRAMRIGTNHGSLSDRIMNRYGDTAFGMVESALEFARVCRKYDYHDFIFSMKASNPLVMVQAYRLLVAEMMKLGWDYPLHLGVTEAGDGEDGRVKSAVGTGALLLEGIGDTIRVSLTEDPWEEIDPCKRLVAFAKNYARPSVVTCYESGAIVRRQVNIQPPLHRDGSVFLYVEPQQLLADDIFAQVGCKMQLGQPQRTPATADALILDELPTDARALKVIEKLQQLGVAALPLAGLAVISSGDSAEWEKVVQNAPRFILLTTAQVARPFFAWLKARELSIPVILCFDYTCDMADLVIHAAAECGALLGDGLGEGLCLKTAHGLDSVRRLSFNILQAARMRSSKTDFISCPGCGRTLFDLQDVTRRIRARTEHLPGVKIAIMGCIVNGPGEMADADFGYVGSKAGKIDLYVGKTCVERNIDFADADERLIQLIKAHGRWVEPDTVATSCLPA